MSKKNDSLSIGEAAQELGLAVDTVRRLANDGKIKTTLTPGGHRRFSRRTLAAYQARGRAPAPRARQNPAPRKSVTPLPSRRPLAPSFEDEYPDDVDELLDEDWSQPPAPEQPPTPPVRPALPTYSPPPTQWRPPKQEEAMQAGKSAADEIQRLDRLKTHGLSAIPFDAPNKWRAKVVEELERFVNADRLPEWVSAWEAQRIVTGRVEEILAPWRHEVEAQRKIQELLDDGMRYARMETVSDWDYEDAEEARREVEKALRAEVEPDWTPSQVRALVDDVLSEWDDEEGDDEPDEDEDDD